MCLQPTSPPPATGKTLFYCVVYKLSWPSAPMPGGKGEETGERCFGTHVRVVSLHEHSGALANTMH